MGDLFIITGAVVLSTVVSLILTAAGAAAELEAMDRQQRISERKLKDEIERLRDELEDLKKKRLANIKFSYLIK